MITILKHGVTIHSAAEGAIIQSLDVDAKVEESNVLGMVSGKTQVVKTFVHTETNEFSVTGKGDLTLVPGTAASANLSSITGGITNILSFKYSQKLSGESEWTYTGKHYPYAA